jgi:Fibronectin type III domain
MARERFTVAWDPAAPLQQVDIGYVVEFTNNITREVVIKDVGSDLSAELQGLGPGSCYSVKVRACNKA